MNRLKIAICILIVLVVFSTFSLFTIHMVLGKTTDSLNEILSLVEQGNNDTAMQLILQTNEKWKAVEHFLTALTRHELIDAITMGFAKLAPYLNAQEYGNFIAQVEYIKSTIEITVASEYPHIYNIF